jgi:hypothetical protein
MKIGEGGNSALKKKARLFKDTEIKHQFFEENKVRPG